jgi:ATP-dependent helicase IRC3
MASKVIININNQKGHLRGPQGLLIRVREAMKVRNPNAFFVRQYMKPGWDGKQDYITEAGYFATGLLDQVIKKIEEFGGKWEIEDNRMKEPFPDTLPSNKQMGFELRGYQKEAVESVITHEVGGIKFPRAIIGAATNAGKTYIIAGLYKAIKLPTLVLINNSELYNQGVNSDFPALVGKDLGYLQGKNYKSGDFMVAMVQTLVIRVKNNPKFKRELVAKYRAIIVDECDLANNATYKSILQMFFMTYIRVGLSGSVLVSDLAKYRIKNQNIRGFFGPLSYEIKNLELIDKGVSSIVKVRILPGNSTAEEPGDLDLEYELGITKNKKRNGLILKRIKYHLLREENHFLIICRYKKHVAILYKLLSKNLPDQNVSWAHGDRKDRKQVIADFKSGKINVLVASLIIRRGMNFPLMQVMFNASGGDAPEHALQLIGRATRKHESKPHCYYYDFHDEGYYLKRHSKHREAVYKKEGFPVLKLYK